VDEPGQIQVTMEAISEARTAALADIAKFTKVQKLAALLITLGQDSASQLMKHLDEHELEAVISEMTKMPLLSQELQEEILNEFNDVAVQASTSIRGGIEFTQTTLEKAVGLFKASNIISRVAPQRPSVAAIQQIVDLEARQIFNLIKTEQPQTIALITSYLPPDKASQLLLMLRQDQRGEVIERLATLSATPIEVVEKIVEVINRRLGGKHTRALNQTGGVKSAADLLNALDKNLSKSFLITLEERNPELSQAIRQKMFTFEDLSNLDPTAVQRILREVDIRDLAVALKTASDKLKNLILGSLSKRAAETVAEEISLMGPLKLRDIEAAQLRIIETVRRLESEGEIELGDPNEKAAA
jgi:flagellar motor switch protein FliG